MDEENDPVSREILPTEPLSRHDLASHAAVPQASQNSGSKFPEEEHHNFERSPSGIFGQNSFVLIDPEKISDFKRFRVIFLGMLLLINASMQGLFALFGIYIENLYNYDAHAMVDIYAVGTIFGLVVLPFGMLYDFFGPRIVVALATVITAVSLLLFGLTFAGHMEASKTRFCIFFAMMNWGCYAFDVAVVPAVLTHIPRDRAQPTGLLKTFSGLGPSLFSCIFRGFFNDRYDHLMYFLMSIVILFGVIGTAFLRIAPYEVMRWKGRRLNLRETLKMHLIRNRYMSQLLPKRRLHIMAFFMMNLNIFLSWQAIYAANNRDTLTGAKYRHLAFGAIAILSFLLIIVLPLHFLDGPTAQDKRVIEKADEKLQELKERQKRRDLENNENARPAIDYTQWMPPNNDAEASAEFSLLPFGANVQIESKSKPVVPSGSTEGLEYRTGVRRDSSDPFQPITHDLSLVETKELLPLDTVNEDEAANALRQMSNRSFIMVMQPNDISSVGGEINNGSGEIGVLTRQLSTYDHPYIEIITVCGEVFVTPVYETTFLQSLTYIDIWMIFYTTFVVWGIGMTLTANWNILIMVGSRYPDLQYNSFVLFATISGISTAVGRVVIGMYEVLLLRLGLGTGISLPGTIGFPLPSILLTISLVFYLFFPGNLSLIAVYVIAPLAYGFSTSITVYVIGIIFKRDIGMHYGFCFLGNALGILLLYRLLFFHVYDQHKLVLPPEIPIDTRGRCQGRNCMNTTLIVYFVLAASSIATSYLVHYRYWKLVRGKLKYRRVIPHLVKKGLSRVRAKKRES